MMSFVLESAHYAEMVALDLMIETVLATIDRCVDSFSLGTRKLENSLNFFPLVTTSGGKTYSEGQQSKGVH